MSREAREKSESGIYHLMLRGINKQNIFEEDEDRKRFLETLGYYKKASNYILYGYCLMDNHIHLLIKEQEESISQIIKRITALMCIGTIKSMRDVGIYFKNDIKAK